VLTRPQALYARRDRPGSGPAEARAGLTCLPLTC
jgi:hypothetical protein